MAPAAERNSVLATASLRGSALCLALSDSTDGWLAELFERAVGRPGVDPRSFALAAVGGYGRRELSPQSDIDVVLLTAPRVDAGSVAEALWYPVWDEGLKLGHAVRTVNDAVDLASGDLDTATSLLSLRHIAGEPSLTSELVERSDAQWRKGARRWLSELSRTVRERHARAGDTAFLLEPDLKDGRGGLRDVHAVHWAQAAQAVMLAGDDEAFTDAYAVLLDARVELHRRTGRRGDVLLLQEQDGVADALGYTDADTFMGQLAAAARTIAWRSDEVWERVDAAGKTRSPLAGLFRRERPEVLGGGITLRDGEVHLDTTGVRCRRSPNGPSRSGTRGPKAPRNCSRACGSPARPPSTWSSRWTRSGCGAASCPNGTGCGPNRNATPITRSPWTVTCARRR